MPANFIPNAARCAKALLPLVVLLLMFAPGVGLHAQATDLHGAATQLTKKLNDDPDVQKIIGEHIVIAPFENINGKGDAVPRILQEMLTTSFIKAKHFKVLERDQLQSALDELHFQLSDLADPAKAKKIGKLAGATYVLLGSISDTGGTTSINTRIVSIESGESVAAEDVDIKTGDAASGVGGLNPSSNPATVTATSGTSQTETITKPETPIIDLNAKATSASAGQYTGQKNNFGLLGGTKFQVAWRENLGKDPVLSFSAGDVLGDGTSRFVEYMSRQVTVAGDDTSIGGLIASRISPMHESKNVVRVSKWEGGRFKQKWESEEIRANISGLFYLRVSPLTQKPALINLSLLNASWRWDGTTYSRGDTDICSIVNWLSETHALGWDQSRFLGIYTWNYEAQKFDLKEDCEKIPNQDDLAVGDFDGDGKNEIAAVVPATSGKPAHQIEIYSLDGVRKATTTDGYDNPLDTWNPMKSAHPFIVAQKHLLNDKGEVAGSYLCFIQWNGETYDEVWHGNQIDDNIIDLQVCDPKSEGKTGLIVLSTYRKGYYLTKIVPAN